MDGLKEICNYLQCVRSFCDSHLYYLSFVFPTLPFKDECQIENKAIDIDCAMVFSGSQYLLYQLNLEPAFCWINDLRTTRVLWHTMNSGC